MEERGIIEVIGGMSDIGLVFLVFLTTGVVVGIVYLIKYLVNTLRNSNKTFDSVMEKVGSEKGLNVLGAILLLIGIAGIVTGIVLITNSAQAYGMSEATYGVVVMAGFLGGAFIGAFGIGILARNSSTPARKRMDDKTKAMVKGAVVGGIIGGDAGAVVGAMIGKEKAEKK